MHVERIMYHKTFNLGNYSSEKIGVEFMLNQGEDAKFALEEARKLVHEYHAQSIAGLDHQHIVDTPLPPEPSVLPSIQVEKEEPQTLEEQIMSCTEFKVLESYYLIVKNKPALQEVYDKKKEELVAKESKEIIDRTNAFYKENKKPHP